GEAPHARATGEFRARAYECFVTPVTDRSWAARRIGLIGAGPKGELDAERIRRIASVGAYAARKRGAASVGWVLSGMDGPAPPAGADGLALADFVGGRC